MVKAGDAFVTVHGDADPDRVSREIKQGFDRGAEIAEADLKDTGRKIATVDRNRMTGDARRVL